MVQPIRALNDQEKDPSEETWQEMMSAAFGRFASSIVIVDHQDSRRGNSYKTKIGARVIVRANVPSFVGRTHVKEVGLTRDQPGQPNRVTRNQSRVGDRKIKQVIGAEPHDSVSRFTGLPGDVDHAEIDA